MLETGKLFFQSGAVKDVTIYQELGSNLEDLELGQWNSHHRGKGAYTGKVGWARTGGLLLWQPLSPMSTMLPGRSSVCGITASALQPCRRSFCTGTKILQDCKCTSFKSVCCNIFEKWNCFRNCLFMFPLPCETPGTASLLRSSSKPELPLLPVYSSLLVSNDWHTNKLLKQFSKEQ